MNYEIFEEGTLGDYQLPKLVLQPLVENAIYHGIKEMDRPGMIRRKYSVYRESHRESRLDVLCAGVHGRGDPYPAVVTGA